MIRNYKTTVLKPFFNEKKRLQDLRMLQDLKLITDAYKEELKSLERRDLLNKLKPKTMFEQLFPKREDDYYD